MDSTRTLRIALLYITLTLVSLGIVMIYSASAIYADQRYGDSEYFLKRHLVSVFLGIVMGCVAMVADYRKLRKWSVVWIVLVFAGLVVVKFTPLSAQAGGATRWIPVLGFHLQPSEFAKIALILYLGDALADKKEELQRVGAYLLKPVFVTLVLTLLVLGQPDLGTAAALAVLFLILLFAAGINRKFIISLFGLMSAAFAIAVCLERYRIQRMIGFIRPWAEKRGAGYQLWQSFLAIGSGGVKGVGLGQSQQKLFYLPAAHTDFIFSIIGEELGFLGAACVILLFIAFIFTGFMIVLKCSNNFGKLTGLGLVSLIGMEAVVNIGVSLGMLPTKGLALPFVSYGGSAIITTLMAVGLLLNISRDATGKVFKKEEVSARGPEELAS